MATSVPEPSTLDSNDLFDRDLINSYVQAPHFVPRAWLAGQVQSALEQPGCRYVLLTAGPGAGKSAFLAWLASQHPGWPRYFIRSGSQTPANSGDARSFLFSTGHQLAALRPDLFHLEDLEIVVHQRLGEVAESGQVTGISVENLSLSPFRGTALLVEQQARIVAGNLVGLSVRNMTVEKRLLDVADLQYLALLDPAAVLARLNPLEPIVILIDALDELRYRPGSEDLLDWLSICPELPANVRLVLTSRPDDELLERFRRVQAPWLTELSIDPNSSHAQNDLRLYAAQNITQGPLREVFQAQAVDTQDFIVGALDRAAGSFQYLAALFRGIDQALAAGVQEPLLRLLNLEEIPAGLGELYAYFISLIREGATDQKIETIESDPFQPDYLPAWLAVYQPILGTLSVARQPLSGEQIQGFGRIRAEARWREEALGRLGQFLARESRRYRLFHPTFGEFLISTQTRQQYPQDYLDPAEWHFKIAAFYRGGAASWDAVDWANQDEYGILHLVWHLQAASDQARYRQALHELVQTKTYHQACLARFRDPWLSLDGLRLALQAALDHEEVADAWLHVRIYADLLAAGRKLDLLVQDAEDGRKELALRRSGLYSDRPYWQSVLRLWLAWKSAANGDVEAAANAVRQACRSETAGQVQVDVEEQDSDLEYYLGEVAGFAWVRLLERVAGHASRDSSGKQDWVMQAAGSKFASEFSANYPSIGAFVDEPYAEEQLTVLIQHLKSRNEADFPRSGREASYRYREELARGLVSSRHSPHWQEYVREVADLVALDHYASYRELALAWILAAVLHHEDSEQALQAVQPVLAAVLEQTEPAFTGDALAGALFLDAARRGKTLDEAAVFDNLRPPQTHHPLRELFGISFSSIREGYRPDPWAHHVLRQSAAAAALYHQGQRDLAQKLLARDEPLPGTYGAYRVQARLSLACRWVEFGELEQALWQVDRAADDANSMKSGVLKTTWNALVERARPWFHQPPDPMASEDELLQRARSYVGPDRMLYLRILSAWWAGQPSRLKRLLPMTLDDPTTADAVLGLLFRSLDPAAIPPVQVERLVSRAASQENAAGSN